MFTIEDDIHCEIDYGYQTFELALTEIRRRVTLPWNELPNCAPCTSWRICGRFYSIYEYDEATTSYTWRNKTPIVKIDATGVKWESNFAPV